MNVHAGPQFGFLLKATEIPVGRNKVDIGDYYKSTDIGMVLGAEGNLPLNLNVTLRYILGFSTVDSGVYDDTNDWRNNVFQISIGYRLFGK